MDYPAVSIAECLTITHVCLEIQADTINGATFAEGGAEAGNNDLCLAFKITCLPG